MNSYIPFHLIEAVHSERLPDPRVLEQLARRPYQPRLSLRLRMTGYLLRVGSRLAGNPMPAPVSTA